MKKILAFVLGTILLASCDVNGTVNGIVAGENGQKAHHVELFDVTFRGETHEYVYYNSYYEGSLSHWAGCKYCKEHENEENRD